MITSQPLFIPLYFDESESDLWLALQQIEPEKRSSFIKGALRQILLGTKIEEFLMQEFDRVPEDTIEVLKDRDYHEEIQVEVLENEVKETEMFSLDDLFAQTNVLDPDESTAILTDHEQTKSIPNPTSGFEYMMKHIIGTEEDETVLRVLKGKRNTFDISVNSDV